MQSADPVICDICGHRNEHSDPFCEACGSKLPGRRAKQTEPSGSRKKSAAPPTHKKSPKQASSFKLESWHYVLGAVVMALIGFFLYSEATREHASVTPLQQPPMQFPAEQTTPPSQEVLDAITRLEKTIKDNPADDGARLLLANALHDAGTHDGSYYPRAITAYKEYLKAKPGDPNARVDLGICYFELGKIDSVHAGELFALAIDEMESSMKANPRHQPGAFNLGIVYLYSGDIAQSNKWMQTALNINPESDLGKRAKTIVEQHKQPS